MKIFKYILLLLLLFSFALTVFVFTKDGRYTFEERMSINLDSEIVLPYIKDNNNWQYWFNFEQSFDKINVNQNGFRWDNGLKKIIKNDLKDSIKFNSTIDDLSNITFLKAIKKQNFTEIIWRGEGEMTFKEKFLYYLPFNSTNSFPLTIKKSLSQLKSYLTNRYLYHDISFSEIETFPSYELMIFPFKSSTDSLLINYYDLQKRSDSILNAKSLKKQSEQFVIYYDNFNHLSSHAFGYVTSIEKDSMFYVSKTKLTTTKPFQAIKVTLKGNYLYKKDVMTKLNKHLEKIKYSHANIGFVVEKPIKNFKDSSIENEWLTEFYFPVKPIIEKSESSNFPQNQSRANQSSQTREETSQVREIVQPVEQISVPEEKQNILPKEEK